MFNNLPNYVNPRIIICEGFGAFNSLKKIFLKEEFTITEDWQIHKIGYINEKLPVLGFKRIYSRFADIEDTVDNNKMDGKILTHNGEIFNTTYNISSVYQIIIIQRSKRQFLTSYV